MAGMFKPSEEPIETSFGNYPTRLLVTVDALARWECVLVLYRHEYPKRTVVAVREDGSGKDDLRGLFLNESSFEELVRRGLGNELTRGEIPEEFEALGLEPPPRGFGEGYNPLVRMLELSRKADAVLAEVGPAVREIHDRLADGPERLVVVGREDPGDGGAAFGAGCLAHFLCWRGERIELSLVEVTPGGPPWSLAKKFKSSTTVSPDHVVLWDVTLEEWEDMKRLEADRQADLALARRRHEDRVRASEALMDLEIACAGRAWSQAVERTLGRAPERLEQPRRPRLLPSLDEIARGEELETAEGD